MENTICFKRFGTMLDCSRNAVMTTQSVKKWIDLTADLGYNTLLLYTEDTYEIDGEPYFGYMRGRYTQKELKEINEYAVSRGMELIPCIQTLAHLNAIVKWPVYREHVDTEDILLAGDEAVYELIDRMFETVSKCFTSRTVNIGMDEAHMIGRGKYYDLHGDRNRSEILIEHVNRVAQIGKKYGLNLIMWSDMFFKLAAGEYYAKDAQIDEEIKKKIPDNVELIYWDYYSTEKTHYDEMLSAHEKLKEGTWFAGGMWSWVGFAPHNSFSMTCSRAALTSCRRQGIQNAFFTMWGDNGGECSKFSLLPSLFYVSQLAKGNDDPEDIREKFKEKYGISFDDFLQLDLPGTPGVAENEICDAEKYLLYNDCFTGLFDTTLAGDEGSRYAACSVKLARIVKELEGTKAAEWSYLFETQQALCEVLSIKSGLGAKTRRVYENPDKAELKELMAEYEALAEKLTHFHKVYRNQWFQENKPHGFDVQDIRLGGLIMRVKSCLDRLEDLYQGKISVIEELEEAQLDARGDETLKGKPTYFNNWEQTVTANRI